MKKWHKLLFAASCVFALIGATIRSASVAQEVPSSESPKASSPDLPADCQIHVIGVYNSENSSLDDRIYVDVKSTGKPMVLVLCGYFGVQWNLNIDKTAEVKEIIISGWFDHSIANVPANIPIKKIIGSPRDNSTPQKKYFWAYSWDTEQGRAMVEQVKALTGHSIDTFQGAYGGKRFTVDGKIGLNPGQIEESVTAIVETDESISLTREQLSDATIVERFVRKSFQLDMDAKRKRINDAEEELSRIKAKFAKRQASAEQLIQERIAALVTDEASSKPLNANASLDRTDEDVADPTGKGWRAWQTQDFDAAIRMFKIAVKREPDNGPAWNGLGWTHLSLAQTESAKGAFEKALVIEPKNQGARNGLGRILMALGELDDAEKELLRATQEIIDEYGDERAIAQGITASWFGLIEVKLMKKDFAGAKEWAERYLKHKPDEQRIAQWLKQAEAKLP